MKSVIVHGVLAAVGLTLAWFVWSGGEAERRSDTEVDIVSCAVGRLQHVVYTSDKKTVRVDVAKGEGPRAWFSHTTPAAPQDKSIADKSTAAAKSTVQRFAAGTKVDGLLKRLAPLKAIRALGEVPADKLAVLELDKPKRLLELKCDGQTHKLAIGATTYGASSRYIRDAGGGTVYLVKASLVSDLEMSRARFMQRDLLDLRLPDVVEAKVKAKGRERTLLHRDRRNPTGANWVDAAEPDKRNELFGNWLTRVTRLRALEYVAEGVEPGSDLQPPIKPVVVVELTLSGDKGGRLGLVKVAGKVTDYFARSPATGGWVKVPATLARQVEDDVPVVLGMEAPAPAAGLARAATADQAPEAKPAAATPRPVALPTPRFKIPTLPKAPMLPVPARPRPAPTE